MGRIGGKKMKKINKKLTGGGLPFTNKNDNLSIDWREYYLVLTPKAGYYGL